jgi:hypothetical protein
MVDLLGWKTDSNSPHLRITTYPGKPGTLPTVLVDDAYSQFGGSSKVTFFREGSPLLNDLDLDVAETLSIRGIGLSSEFNLQPVLMGTTGSSNHDQVWIATSAVSPTAYIPGLPVLGEDENLARFSTIVFLNAVRWVLHERRATPLYTLTTPDHPHPEGNRLPLHPEEGNTALPVANLQTLDALQPTTTNATREPIWPLICSVACVALILERLLTFWVKAWH